MLKNLRITIELDDFGDRNNKKEYDKVVEYINSINDQIDHTLVIDEELDFRNSAIARGIFDEYYSIILREIAEDVDYCDHDIEYDGNEVCFGNIMSKNVYADGGADYAIHFLADYEE